MSEAEPSAAGIVLKARRTVFENSRFHVYADWVAGEGGLEVKDYLVVAPRFAAGDLVTGVTVLPIWNDHIVLLKTFRHAIRRETLEAPRGFIDHDETPRQAAVRELAEETGLAADPANLVDLGNCAPEGSTIAARIALFAAPDCRMVASPAADEIGLGRYQAISLRDAETLLQEMRLEDPTTALCLHRYFLWVEKNR
ncbi:MAG TPA: NUDIX hydrolase [Terriglobia bacterium]|nr:NUDIX hydrolase [Terriglobia bacterium]